MKRKRVNLQSRHEKKQKTCSRRSCAPTLGAHGTEDPSSKGFDFKTPHRGRQRETSLEDPGRQQNLALAATPTRDCLDLEPRLPTFQRLYEFNRFGEPLEQDSPPPELNSLKGSGNDSGRGFSRRPGSVSEALFDGFGHGAIQMQLELI